MTSGVRPRILLAEDDGDVRDFVRQVLEDAGCVVVPAADGQEALDLLQAGPAPDLLVLDLKMPRKDGWAVLRELEARPAGAPSVVIQTAALDFDAFRQALAHGVLGVLPKPFAPARLLTLLARCLESSPTASGSERRQAARRRLHAPVTVTHAGGPAPGVLLDLSSAGSCVEIPARLAPGTAVGMEIDLPGGAPRLDGLVRWAARPAPEARHGLSFTTIPDRLRADIEDALAEVRGRPAPA